jgi:hypothetical protein
VAHDAAPDRAVEVRNRCLHVLRTGREEGGFRGDGLCPAHEDESAVLIALERFDPLLPEQRAVALGLPSQPFQELWTRDPIWVTRAIVRARDPQRPAAAVIDHEDVTEVAREIDRRRQATRPRSDHDAVRSHALSVRSFQAPPRGSRVLPFRLSGVPMNGCVGREFPSAEHKKGFGGAIHARIA